MSSGNLAGPLDGDQPHETQTAYGHGFLKSFRRHSEDDPLNASPLVEADTRASHHHRKLEECALRLVKITAVDFRPEVSRSQGQRLRPSQHVKERSEGH